MTHEDQPMQPAPITEEWLQSVGFKWHQLERMKDKHWLLWLGGANPAFMHDDEDLGIELTPDGSGTWFCWLRSDFGGRYSRFVHIRHLATQHELVRMIEGLTGQAWNPDNHLYGGVRTPEHAARLRERARRLDRELLQERQKWRTIEQDDSRGGALPEHLEAAERARGAIPPGTP